MNDLIFFGADKIKTVTRKTLSSHFDKALERVKIETKNRCLVIHSFRHTYNTLLKPLLPKQVLQSMTGHRTDSMTERYNHPSFEDEYDQIVKYETVLDSLI